MSANSQLSEALPACIPDGLDSILLNKSPMMQLLDHSPFHIPGQGPDPMIDSQLAELLLLLQQQQEQQQQQQQQHHPGCGTPEIISNDLTVLNDQSVNAEQAIDAEITQLLALKQAKQEERRRGQLMLLQQLAAGVPGNAAAISADVLAEAMTGLQGRDMLGPQQQTQRRVSLTPTGCQTPTSFSPSTMAAPLAAAPCGGFRSRASIDLGYMQHRMSPVAATLEAVCDVRSPGSAGSLPMPYTSLALQGPIAAAGVPLPLGATTATSLALQADGMAESFGTISLQDSCNRSPSEYVSALLPLPVLSGLAHPALSPRCGFEPQQQQQQQRCGMLSPGEQMQAYCNGSFSQGQLVGRVRSSPEVVPGSAPGCGLYVSSPMQMPAACPAGQVGRTRRHSFHLTPSTPPGAAAGFSPAYRAAGAPAAAPTAPLPVSNGNRRASFCVYSQGGVLVGPLNTPFTFDSGCRSGASMPAGEFSVNQSRQSFTGGEFSVNGSPQSFAAGEFSVNRSPQSFTAGDFSVAGSAHSFSVVRPHNFEPAMLPLQECPAARPASAAACTGMQQGLPACAPLNQPYYYPGAPAGACGGAAPAAAASSLQYMGAAQAAAGCGAGRRSIDLPCHAAAPKWAGSFWHPLVDVLKSGRPASKGTGVFMPRTAAAPAAADRDQAS